MPFELGRPLGVPGDPAWQTRVLRAVLELLDAPSGPVLTDFPDDAPVASDQPAVLACPVDFPAQYIELNDMEQLNETLQYEVRELRSWYDLAVKNSGRTTVGASGLDPEALGRFIGVFLEDDSPASPRGDMPVLDLLKLAVEDLKAYYLEAVAAQPGQATAPGTVLTDWFWKETAAGKIFYTLQDRWKDSDNRSLQQFSRLILVPRAYAAGSPYADANA
ncbi:MAG: hypothetical protein O3A93_01815 [Chloroflexi bacterium]|nr:hypothetical protein [Chloroflexota bacterium]MDA1269983.1 hypothetical protein [Chloroflexota bacterium]